MRIFPLASVTIVLLGATACSYERRSAYTALELMASAPIEAPVLGARDGNPTTLNSDNHPVVARTGLNSDPNNPEGTPRPSYAMTHYGQ